MRPQLVMATDNTGVPYTIIEMIAPEANTATMGVPTVCSYLTYCAHEPLIIFVVPQIPMVC